MFGLRQKVLQRHSPVHASTYVENVAGQVRPLVYEPAAALTSGAYVTLFVGLASRPNRQYASQAAGFAAVTIAAVVLIGWWAGLPLLSSWGSGLPPMRPVGALCLAALGLALMHPGKDSRFAFAVGLALAALGALGVILVLFNVEFGIIDRWLAPWAGVPELGAASFRVASAATVAFGLVGGSLALSRFERHRFAATILCGTAGAVAVFVLLGYLIGVDTLYGSASVNSPPLPTAVGLLCVAGGIILWIGTMPAPRKSRPLWHLLVMLGCVIVAPLLLFGAYAGFRIADAQFRDVRENLTIEARTLSANVDREIIGEMERLQALAASPSLRHGDFAEFQHQAEASLALRRSGNIVLIDRNMQQLVNTAVPFGKPLPGSAVPKLVERVLATGQPQVSDLFMAPITKLLLVTIIVPVEIEGESRYALARAPEQRTFARLVAAKELPAGWRAVVSDATHRIIAHSGNQYEFIGQDLPPAQWPRAGSGGLFEFIDSDGRPSLEASVRSELTGWETAVWAPRALLEAPVRAQWRTVGVTALLAIALVVASALWLGRIIARSVGHAARAAIALGKGGPLPSDETPLAEVDTLMAELRGAAARRHAAEQDLQASKDRLQLAFNATQLGWWQYDPQRRMVAVDTRTKEIFDLTADETPIEEVMERVHPDDAERFWANREAALDPANPKPYAHEYRVRRRDGTIRWVEGYGLAYFEGAGSERRAVSFGGTAQDITERKEREEKEHLLMREINHRAKNMLSVVDAIAHQTATKNPEDFVERFSERIQALSANQDLLVRNEWNGVEIADLVRAQLAHFADLIGARIAMHGPKLRLNPASAQAIGLALHELATNAGKYGALSTDTGRVNISWETEGDTLTMSWTERNGPRVAPPRRRGFGTIVMEAMAERSVDGTVDLDYAPSGLTWRLTCPAANALEPREHKPNFRGREKSN
jgi:PAS domain S-box-containing protein